MRDHLIRLGSSQLVIVGVGLLTVVFVAYEAEWPLWDDIHTRAYALPRMEERWGFRFGTIRVERDGGEYYGIIGLTPDGRLARLGLRVHDMPVSFQIDGVPASLVLYRALLARERGERSTFYVVNVDEWAGGRGNLVVREIDLQPGR